MHSRSTSFVSHLHAGGQVSVLPGVKGKGRKRSGPGIVGVGALEPESIVRRFEARALYVVFASLPFTSALSLSPLLPLPLLVVASIFLWSSIKRRRMFRLRPGDLTIVVIVMLGIGPLLLSTWTHKSTAHTAAFLVSWIVYGLMLRSLLVRASSNAKDIAQLTLVLAYVSAIAAIVDFLTTNILGWRLIEHIPTANAVPPPSLALHTWIRPTGVAIEAGHMALPLVFAMPFLTFVRDLPPRLVVPRAIAVALSASALALTYSAAAIGAVSIGLVAGLMFGSIRSARVLIGGASAAAALLSAFLLFDTPRSYFQQTVIYKGSGLLGLADVQSTSVQDRRERFRLFGQIILNRPLGVGWGTVSAKQESGEALWKGQQAPTSFVSVYADVAAATGIMGGLLLVAYLLTQVSSLLGSSHPAGYPLAAGSIALLAHFLFVGNYWYPFLWLIPALSAIVPSTKFVGLAS